MLKTRHTLLSLALTLALVLSFAPLAGAQDDGSPLSEDEIALLTRAIESGNRLDEVESLSYMVTTTERQNFSVSQDGNVIQSLDSTVTQIADIGYIGGDNPSFSASISAVQEGDEPYEANGQMIYVDETLYLSATAVEGNLTFPEGFIVVAEDTFLGDNNIFEPRELANSIVGDDEETNILEAIQELQEVVLGVTLSEGVEFNGTAVDVVSFGIDREGFLALIESGALESDDMDEETLALFERAEINGTFEIGIYPDSETTAFISYAFQINIVDLPMSEIDPEIPEGFTATFDISLSEREDYISINAEVAPITAPEVSQ